MHAYHIQYVIDGFIGCKHLARSKLLLRTVLFIGLSKCNNIYMILYLI